MRTYRVYDIGFCVTLFIQVGKISLKGTRRYLRHIDDYDLQC